jgi:hypothetical protein
VSKPRMRAVVQPVYVEGNPLGNRQQRRMARRLARLRNDGRPLQQDEAVAVRPSDAALKGGAA